MEIIDPAPLYARCPRLQADPTHPVSSFIQAAFSFAPVKPSDFHAVLNRAAMTLGQEAELQSVLDQIEFDWEWLLQKKHQFFRIINRA